MSLTSGLLDEWDDFCLKYLEPWQKIIGNEWRKKLWGFTHTETKLDIPQLYLYWGREIQCLLSKFQLTNNWEFQSFKLFTIV
jgi:hypothetical protein